MRPYANPPKQTQYRIKDLFLAVLAGFAAIVLLLWVSQIVLDIPIYASSKTFLLLLCVIFLVVYFLIAATGTIENCIILALSFFFMSSVLQRYVTLIVYPLSFGWEDNDGGSLRLFSIEELDQSISLLVPFIIVTFIGAKFGVALANKDYRKKIVDDKLIEDHRRSFLPLFRLAKIVSLMFFISVSLQAFLTYMFGWKMGEVWENGWLARLIPTPILMYFTVVLLVLYRQQLSATVYFFALAGLGLNGVSSLFGGSRGSLYILSMIFLFWMLYLKGNFLIHKRWVIGMLGMGIVMGPLVWVSGTAFRHNEELALDINSLVQAIPSISKRLGSATDNFIISASDWGDAQVLEQYINVGDSLKRAINGMVPGDPFTVSFEDAGAMHKKIFWNDYSDRVHGEVWSAFGWFYSGYGVTGGIIALFVVTTSFSFVITFLSQQSFAGRISGFIVLVAMIDDYLIGGYPEKYIQAILHNVLMLYLVLSILRILTIKPEQVKTHAIG